MLIVALVLMAGLHCTAGAEEGARDWSLIALVSADGDLTRLGEQYARGLTEAAISGGWTLALQIDNGSEQPSRRLLIEGREAQVTRPPIRKADNCAHPAALVDFFDWAADAATARRYAVIVYGHGVSASGRGWNGRHVAAWPALAIDASAGGDPLQPDELADGIAGGLGRKVDVVILDCCYGASLENAWALRSAADLLVASPARLPSTGLSWPDMLGRAENVSPEILVQRWFADQRVLTATRTDGLGDVRTAIRRLCDVLADDMRESAPTVTAALSECARWGREGEMYDLRSFCSALAAGDDTVADAARETIAALDRCVRGRAVTMPLAAGLAAGPTSWRPEGFTETSGWGEMTRIYRNRLDELMHRTFDDRRHDGAAT